MTSPTTYVICISTGRSGTTYLANLLDCSSNADVNRELSPRPSFVLERMNLGKDYETYARYWCLLKSMDERRRWERQYPHITVVGDVSHVWGKSVTHPDYHPLLDELGVEPKGALDLRVVHLTRNERNTVRSLLRYGGHPSLFAGGLHFSMSPWHPLAVDPWPDWQTAFGVHEEPLGPMNVAGRAALAIWYRAQMEHAARRAHEVWGEAVADFTIEELNTREGVNRLHAFVGCETNEEKLARHFRVPANSTASHGGVPVDLTDEAWEAAKELASQHLS